MGEGRASLGMYDLPELHEANNALWWGIRRSLGACGVVAPADLDRAMPLERLWRAGDLLLAQTCGYPFVTALQAQVRYVATPCYAAPGCDGAMYRSALIVREDDPAIDLPGLRGRCAIINDHASQSGMNALRHAAAACAVNGRFFSEVSVSGGHRASVAAVREGRADVAAIDAVTWALIGDVAPAELLGLRVLAWSAPAPGLPLITAGTNGERVAALRRALTEVIADPELAPVRRPLRLSGVEVLDEGAYATVDRMRAEAEACGYPELA